MLTNISDEKFEFSTLHYINITKQMKKGLAESKGPSILTFFYDDIDNIPEEVIEAAGIKKKSLEEEGSIGNII